MTYLSFDIGGTNTRLAHSEDGKTLAAHTSFKTSQTPGGFLEKVSKYLADQDIKNITGIGGGIRGRLLEDWSGMQYDSVLTGWQGFSLTAALEELTGSPVALRNDAAIAGLGEAWFGAGQGADIMVYHTVSTGVGGAKIEYGVIDDASVGFEPGHQVLDIDRTILGEDISPTLENLVSGTALQRRTGMKPKEIPQDDVIWDELASYLAQGLRNSILYWSPEAIVLGGSMMVGDPKIPLDTVRREVVRVLDGIVPAPFITLASLGDEAGLYGGLVLARDIK